MAKPNSERQEINDIFRLFSSGQIEQAEERCRSYLLDSPDDINILGLLGAVLLKLGRGADAKPILERTIRLEPAFAKPYEDLGMLYLHEGDPSQATRYFEDAIRLDGKQASAYGGLAQALRLLGKDEQAAAARQRYLKLSPVVQALIETNKLLSAGDTARAEQICAETLKQYPDNIDVLRMLAIIASEDKRYVIAEGLLKKIVKLSVNNYRPYSDLGRFLGERGRIPEAIEMLERAVAFDSTVVSVHLALANFLAILGTPADALKTYDAAMQLDPDYPPALLGRGNMLRILGRRDEAIVAYERVVDLHPEVGSAWWSLASLGNYRFSTEKVDEMRSHLDSDELDVDSKFSFRFALARVCETGKDFDGAWENYELGNSLKRAQVGYDPVGIEVSHDKIIQLFDREFLELNSSRPTEDGPAPIFIVGMPRSGSTLLEQILASHSQVEGTGELPYVPMLSEALGGARSDGKKYPQVLDDMTKDQLVSIGKSYIYHTKTNRPENRPRFTDKMPANFAHVGFIHLTLPNAKIIDARRHPLDTCIGNYRQLFAQGKNHAYDLNECAEYFLEYIRLMDHWDNVLPGRVLKVQYEDVVDDVEKQTRRMLEYCELPWEDACLNYHASDRAVNTASAEQVREPIYRDAVGYWKNYESQLADIQEILSPVLSGGT